MNVEKTAIGLAIVGAVGVGAYLVVRSTSQSPVENTSCAGDWTDYFNPVCWLGGVTTQAANAGINLENELNTVLIIVAVVIVLVVGFLAYGPGTEHIAKGAGALAL